MPQVVVPTAILALSVPDNVPRISRDQTIGEGIFTCDSVFKIAHSFFRSFCCSSPNKALRHRFFNVPRLTLILDSLRLLTWKCM